MAFEYKAFATFFDPDTGWNIEVYIGEFYACTGADACLNVIEASGIWQDNYDKHEWQLVSVRNDPTGD